MVNGVRKVSVGAIAPIDAVTFPPLQQYPTKQLLPTLRRLVGEERGVSSVSWYLEVVVVR